MTNNKNKTQGFTLIELMVVISLIGLLIVIAFPLLTSNVQNTRLQNASESSFSYFQLAKSLSFKRDTNLYLKITSGTNWCLGISDTSGCNCANSTCTVNGVLYTLNASDFTGVSLAKINLSDELTLNKVQNDFSSGVTDAAGSLNFLISSKTATINIAEDGLVTQCSSDLPGVVAC
jgi:type IV fimbrial biogenesis protein FimT